MIADMISKPVYQVLSDLTQESRVEVALPLAMKELLRLKLKEVTQQRISFEQRYKMDFATFKHAWEAGDIPHRYSYAVEQDYWEWEATMTDELRLSAMHDRLL